jgi:hypothetical protein
MRCHGRHQVADTKRTHQKRQRATSRCISDSSNGAICRRMCVASERACTRVTPGNLHGKGRRFESVRGLCKSPVNRPFLLREGDAFFMWAGAQRIHGSTWEPDSA